MSMLWHERRSTVTSGIGGALFVRLLGAATIAAVASACSTIETQPAPTVQGAARSDVKAPAEEPAPSAIKEPPPIIALPPSESEPILTFLRSHGYQDASNVLVMTIGYATGEGENLIAFNFSESPEIHGEFPTGYFVIPTVGVNFEQVIAIHTGSPQTVTGCTPGGGTLYC